MSPLMRLSEIVCSLNGHLPVTGPDFLVESVASLDTATPNDISFLSNPKYKHLLPITKAGAVLLSEMPDIPVRFQPVIVENPYLALAKLLTLLHPPQLPAPGIHPSVIMGRDVCIGPHTRIAPHVVIGDGSIIGEDTAIFAGTVIGEHVTIGRNSIIYPNVSIYHQVFIGDRVIIHASAVIGSDGFGFAKDRSQYIKMPQIGTVKIEDDVEIGAGCTIDRGSTGTTVISKGVKLDNLIHLAHNVHIGEDTAIAAQTGVSGSTIIGKRVTIGGQAGLAGHIKIGDDAILTAKSGITKSAAPGTMLSGFPSDLHKRWLRNQGVLAKGIEMKEKIHELENRIQELEKRLKSEKERNP